MRMDYERRLAIVKEVLDGIALGSYRIEGPTMKSGFPAFIVHPLNPKSASLFLEATDDDECFHLEGINFFLKDGDESTLRVMIEAVAKGNFKIDRWSKDFKRGSLKVGKRWRTSTYWAGPFFKLPFLKRTQFFEPYK